MAVMEVGYSFKEHKDTLGGEGCVGGPDWLMTYI